MTRLPLSPIVAVLAVSGALAVVVLAGVVIVERLMERGQP